ncbi:MAG: hypothetical protein CMM84_16310 [Rhodothermaceae bacterium]|nr:hypothetical protein [Rhodothermaceae bacterium]MAQ95079.1 hypothetical protein [Rhodothermaceae bacterium]MBC12491.1 hypothetical protein [Rhodothermaceae bacterium]
MRRAVAYARTSSGRQRDNTSIPDQLRICRARASRYQAAIVAEFTDEAVSAKRRDGLSESFAGRVGWNALLSFLAAEAEAGRVVDLVLVKDYKRFSRDIPAGHAEIQRLGAMGVELQAVEQHVDPSVPAAKILRSIYLADGEVDNDYRSRLARSSMVARLASGVFIHKPPVGYRATHAGGKRTGIEPDPELAPLVREAFAVSADPARSLDAGRQHLAARIEAAHPGQTPRAVQSRSRWKDVLVNRVYLGEVHVPAHGTPGSAEFQPERWVEGTHEAVISAELWARVQARIHGRSRPQSRRGVNPGVPLRGLVRAPRGHRDAGAVCTGSGPRGKSGERVWYYHTSGAGAYRVLAREVHAAADELLASLAPSPGVAALVSEIVRERLLGVEASAEAQRERARAALDAAESRLFRAAEAAIEGTIDPETHKTLTERYRADRDRALADLDEADSRQGGDAVAHVERAARLACDLPRLWASSSPARRLAIGGSILPTGFEVEGGAVVEPRLSPIMALLFSLSGTEGPKTETPAPGGSGRVPLSDPDET